MGPVGPLHCSLAECLPNRQESRYSRSGDSSTVSVEKAALECPPLRTVSRVNMTTLEHVLLPSPMSFFEQKHEVDEVRVRRDF